MCACAYHIDRSKTLYHGQIITLIDHKPGTSDEERFLQELFPNGISQAGVVYSSDIHYKMPEIAQRFKELEFEYIRRFMFNDKPSRFQSFFCVESNKEARAWKKHLELDKDSSVPIWKVRIPDRYVVLDAFWRDRQACIENTPIYSAWEEYLDACNYWSALRSETPRLEIVIPLTLFSVEVLERVS